MLSLIKEIRGILERVHREQYTTPGKTLGYAQVLLDDLEKQVIQFKGGR